MLVVHNYFEFAFITNQLELSFLQKISYHFQKATVHETCLCVSLWGSSQDTVDLESKKAGVRPVVVNNLKWAAEGGL
jgi:hypothetical protein